MRRLALALPAASSSAPCHRVPAISVPGTEDVPLMPVTSPRSRARCWFSTSPKAASSKSAASGAVARNDVTRFYAQSLPQLGWRRMGAGTSWQREGERLRVNFRGTDGALTVNFTLSPR